MKIVTVIGARPQFVKAAAVSRVLRESVQEIYVHTGQHYDQNMSGIFFHELGIPEPDYNLGIGGSLHGQMTGRQIEAIEEILIRESPDSVMVYGDTNSTLAGALAAVKLHIPIIHVEAGLRSFNRKMPEEINRVLVDHISTVLFCPTDIAKNHLAREGITTGVFVVGDVMMDSLHYFSDIAKTRSNILNLLNIEPQKYILLTMHRAENVDDDETLFTVLKALNTTRERIIFPVHPRTKSKIKQLLKQDRLIISSNIVMIDPVGYLDMILLESNAKLIMTDSGGVQKEAYWFRVPCITLRDETEWIETLESGWNQLVAIQESAICNALETALPSEIHPDYYGKGDAAVQIIKHLKEMARSN